MSWYASKYELALGGTGNRIWWARATHRANFCTGELIELPSWVKYIHPEDIEWFERQWEDEDRFDYKLRAEGIYRDTDDTPEARELLRPDSIHTPNERRAAFGLAGHTGVDDSDT